MKKSHIGILLVSAAILFVSVGFVQQENIYFSINKNIDIFGRVFKEIAANYVDEVDPEKFMRAGIDGMLGTLDPYTVYMKSDEGEEIDLITHGQYGGIGVSIGVRDGIITVIAPMEGYSAHKQGVKAGDRIVEIDGWKVTGSNPDSVRSRVRGEPGSIVKITVEREGASAPIEFALVREEIQVHNVHYADYVSPGIGYISVERFSRRAGEEVRQAIKELKAKGALQGLIIDLRDNPGGLLDAAVEIVSKFLPKGSTVVSTRGRTADQEKVYSVTEEPIAKDVPLVILINKGSASASEIVAGAIQDYDRGVILGTRSFGKGLVQTIVQLNYDAQMKITTARYYTPSGRCIQEIDYLHKNKDGVFLRTPDSLRKSFTTKNGRVVMDQGGIMPDTVVDAAAQSPFFQELMRKGMFFKFATSYVVKRPTRDQEFTADDSVRAAFEEYTVKQKFEFVDDTQKRINELHATLEQEKYSDAARNSFRSFMTAINQEQISVYRKYSAEITAALEEEINGRYFGEKGQTRTALRYDEQVKAAADLLRNAKAYRSLLQQGKTK